MFYGRCWSGERTAHTERDEEQYSTKSAWFLEPCATEILGHTSQRAAADNNYSMFPFSIRLENLI